jgi:hypothetical protein
MKHVCADRFLPWPYAPRSSSQRFLYVVRVRQLDAHMTWLGSFYSSSVAIPLSLLILAAISLLSWKRRGRQITLALTLFLYARYLLWRGLYTLNTEDWASLLISWMVLLAEAYGLVQFIFFTFPAWAPLQHEPPPSGGIPPSMCLSRW